MYAVVAAALQTKRRVFCRGPPLHVSPFCENCTRPLSAAIHVMLAVAAVDQRDTTTLP